MLNMEESSAQNQTRCVMFPVIHSKEFQCPVCAKYFSRKFTLDAHMLIHKGEKPHTCQFCGKCFRQKGTLMRHKALHSAKYLFHCSLCNQGFRQKNVFIFHLRHRHNVSTETLDRRKYRTEPKDYQSIIDTLPPFVQVDSTAISSSGDHFDAMLCESVQNSVKGSEMLQGDYTTENHMQYVHNNIDSLNIAQENQNNCDNSKLKNLISVYKENCKSSFDDVNPRVSNFCKIETPELSVRNSSMLPVNSVSSCIHNVTSSDDVNDENIMCIPCQLNFTSELEFKYHMKTHVQSVLLTDVNTSETQMLSDISDVQYKTSKLPDSEPASNLFTEDKLVSDIIPHSQTTCDKVKFPVETEVLDPEIDSYSLQSDNNAQVPANFSFMSKNKSPQNQYKLKCPICKVYLSGDSAFKKHSKKHNSYLLLKLIYNSFEKEKDICKYQNTFSSVIRASDNHSHEHVIKDDKKLQLKFHTAGANFKKSLVKTEHVLTKRRPVCKMLACAQCDKKFPNKFLLEYHRQLHLSTKGFFCRCCKSSFSSKKSLLSHTRLHHMKVLTCCKCSQVFNYRRLYDSHKKLCRKSVNSKNLNGSCFNFPVVNIESLLKSDVSDIVGIIPVSTESEEEKELKFGIPVMSVSHIKTMFNLNL